MILWDFTRHAECGVGDSNLHILTNALPFKDAHFPTLDIAESLSKVFGPIH